MMLSHLKPFISAFFLLGCLLSNPLIGQTLEITRRDSAYQVSLSDRNLVYLSAPEEGLWSIALGWENNWPADWRHAQPTALTRQGEWAVLSGKLQLPQGEWWFQDAYRMEKRLARTMYLSCGQLIAPNGAHGEQIQETNFAQHGEMDDVFKLRGGYSESWTVFWITAHFLHAAAQFKALGVTL
jgi:hypothetical protein